MEQLNIPSDQHEFLKAKVSDFTCDGVWILPQSLYDMEPNLAVEIRNVVIPISNIVVDHIIWPYSDPGILNLKDAYKFLNPFSATSKLFKMIWCFSISPSKSFVTWRLFHNRIPTDECLRSKGCIVVSRCDLCMQTDETPEHLFLSCCFSQAFWNWLCNCIGCSLDLSSFTAVFSVLERNWSSQVYDVIKSVIVNVFRWIWHCRNQCRFQNVNVPLSSVISGVEVTNLTGTHSMGTTSNSMEDFKIPKAFNINGKVSKAQRIIQVTLTPPPPPPPNWIKCNSDGSLKDLQAMQLVVVSFVDLEVK